MKRWVVFLMSLLASLPGLRAQSLVPTPPGTAVAFFYDANPPWAELQAFDLVVVDPGHVPNPKLPVLSGLHQQLLRKYKPLGNSWMHPPDAR